MKELFKVDKMSKEQLMDIQTPYELNKWLDDMCQPNIDHPQGLQTTLYLTEAKVNPSRKSELHKMLVEVIILLACTLIMLCLRTRNSAIQKGN